MAFLNLRALGDKSVELGLEALRGRVNDAITRYGTITRVEVTDGRIRLYGHLLGMEDREVWAQAGKIVIARDGSRVSLADFTSNVPGIANALNDFATARSIEIPEGFIRTAILLVRKMLVRE